MAAFLYFLPNRAGATASDLAEVGLASVLDMRGLATRETASGPGGHGGIIVSLGKPSDVRFDPEAQEWRACNDGAYFLGWFRDTPPTPDDLAREDSIPGHKVALSDGGEWVVPMATSPVQPAPVPRRLSIDASGNWQQQIETRFAGLCERAERAWELFQRDVGLIELAEGETPSELMPEEEQTALAVEALAVNYRVSQWEVGYLGLLSTTNRLEILKALFDWPTIIAIQKALAENAKKNGDARTDDGNDTADGERG